MSSNPTEVSQLIRRVDQLEQEVRDLKTALKFHGINLPAARSSSLGPTRTENNKVHPSIKTFTQACNEEVARTGMSKVTELASLDGLEECSWDNPVKGGGGESKSEKERKLMIQGHARRLALMPREMTEAILVKLQGRMVPEDLGLLRAMTEKAKREVEAALQMGNQSSHVEEQGPRATPKELELRALLEEAEAQLPKLTAHDNILRHMQRGKTDQQESKAASAVLDPEGTATTVAKSPNSLSPQHGDYDMMVDLMSGMVTIGGEKEKKKASPFHFVSKESPEDSFEKLSMPSGVKEGSKGLPSKSIDDVLDSLLVKQDAEERRLWKQAHLSKDGSKVLPSNANNDAITSPDSHKSGTPVTIDELFGSAEKSGKFKFDLIN